MAVLRNMGAVDEDGKVKLAPTESREVAAVRETLPHILRAARAELTEMQAAVAEQLPSVSEEDRDDLLQKQKDFGIARVQLDNWRDDGFLVVDDERPNAFTHQFVPRVIFVQRGLFWRNDLEPIVGGLPLQAKVALPTEGNVWKWGQVCAVNSLNEVTVEFSGGTKRLCAVNDLRQAVRRETIVQSDEQLAMLLGHELAHVVHCHEEDRGKMAAMTAGFQLVILSMLDPTGMLAFAFQILAAQLASFAVVMPASRSQELEADLTGLRIAARAGFDPRVAPSLFERMAAHEDTAPRGISSWASSHPQSADRVAALAQAVEGATELFERDRAERACQVEPRVARGIGGGLSRFVRAPAHF